MALAKKSMTAAAQADECRVFFLSQQHIDDYHKSYAKHDIHGYGPTRRLVVEGKNGETQTFQYTHTTPFPLSGNTDTIKKGYKIDDAEIVWHGPSRHIVHYGADVHAPRSTPENTL